MNWIKNISDSLMEILSSARFPAQTPPVVPLYCEEQIRPGLSATALSSKIISRLPDIGIPTDDMPDGSENINNKFVRLVCEEVVKAIKEDGVVMCGLPTGVFQITGTGGNAGGPVQITGFNSMPTIIKGVIQ